MCGRQKAEMAGWGLANGERLAQREQLFCGEAKILCDPLDQFRMKRLASVIRDGDPDPLRIAEDLVASRLPNLRESSLANDAIASSAVRRGARLIRSVQGS